MFKAIARFLWGKFESVEEFKKFSWLASIFFLIIGVYWSLRPIKDSVFNAIVGGDLLPKAKIASLFVIVPLVIIYGKCIDKFPRHRVFYALCGLYGTIGLLLAAAFMHPTLGLPNTVASSSRLIGWVWYVYVESFGSLIVALFWAITADTTLPDSAKRGFPIIALAGQTGNIFGPLILNAKRLGFPHSGPVVGICGVLIILVGVLFYFFMQNTPAELLSGYHGSEEGEKDSEPGFLEGLKLLLTRGYLLGIFLVIGIYESILTILDYHFKSSVFAAFTNESDVAAYLNNYAVMTGVVATLCVLLGINNIQRKLGMTASLVLLPILMAVAVGFVKMYPNAISVAFWIMVLAKAVNYALNQPTLKQLYIPTTKDTKYKAQA